MRVAVTGSTGLVGSALMPALEAAGHTVVRLVRPQTARAATPSNPSNIAEWNPETGDVNIEALGDVDAVVHLAGENVAAGRWTQAQKRRIEASRGPATEKLCRTLASLERPPSILISASATGIYGDRGAEELHEESAIGSMDDFLTKVAADWEAGTQALTNEKTRVVNLRIGLVLASSGGALARMITPFKLGLGGRIGSGAQWMSWITLHDLVRAIIHTLGDDSIQGPVLAVAPTPVTNRTFTTTLGKVLGRPTFLLAPAFAIKWALGEMSNLLLHSQRARPHQLLEAGFEFDHANLATALQHTTQDTSSKASTNPSLVTPLSN
jgi:uncharacterized protein